MNYLVCGYLGYDNLGDELMANAISSSLFARDKYANIVFFAKKGKKYDNFACIDRFCLTKIIKNIRKCDVFILGGGTLISERSSKRSLWYYSSMLFLAKIMKKRRIIWAGGIDRIHSKSMRSALGRLLCGSDISVRDTSSLDALWEILPSPKAKIHADPVFLLANTLKRQPSIQRNTLTVCIKEGAPKDLAIMIGSFCKKNSLNPVFAATSPSDLSECRRQGALIGAPCVLLFDLKTASDLFDRSVLCLTMRYHAALIAACRGCIPISMSSHEKIRALMMELYLSRLILPGVYSYKKYEDCLEYALNNNTELSSLCLEATKKMLRRAKLAEAFW